GIRDLTVTGVQTCALPIWACACAGTTGAGPRASGSRTAGSSTGTPARAGAEMRLRVEPSPMGGWRVMAEGSDAPVSVHDTEEERSEERRVGKEGRSGWER